MGGPSARRVLIATRAKPRHAAPRQPGAVRGVLAWVLLACGAAMIAYPLLVLRFSSAAQARLVSETRDVARRDAPSSMPVAEGALLGTIEIPAIGLEAAFLEGVSDPTLLAAPGHLPGTALPGERGASVVAAHRDLHFRDLHAIETGDPVHVRLPSGVARFRVDRVDVVPPDAAWVTAPTRDPVLRLVTCWPPRFAGPAPERLVVSAALVDPARSPARSREAPRYAFEPAALTATSVPAAGSATAGAVMSVMAFFAAARGRRDRSTFALLCLGTMVIAASLVAGGSPAG